MSDMIATHSLGKCYGRHWALRDCSIVVPRGSVTALVGPNGAGKSSLLHMIVGLIEPTTGSVKVLDHSPLHEPRWVLPRVGFVAQDHPLYRRFTVNDMLTMGAKLDPRWDMSLAKDRLGRLDIPSGQKVGTLSGGQQAQVALVMALAKRPELMVLDEPMSALDPLARREFLSTLMEAAADDGVTILLSSHIIADLARVCDHLILLAGGAVRLNGDIEEIVGRHKLLVSSRRDPASIAHIHNVVLESHTGRQTTLLVKTNGHIWDRSWEVKDLSLEDLILAYLSRGRSAVAGSVREREPVEARS